MFLWTHFSIERSLQSAALVDPPSAALDTEESLSLEEKLRRERQRQMAVGMTNYAWSQNTKGPQRILALLQVWCSMHWCLNISLSNNFCFWQGNLYATADLKSEFKLLFDKVEIFLSTIRTLCDNWFLHGIVWAEFDRTVRGGRGPAFFAGRKLCGLRPGTKKKETLLSSLFRFDFPFSLCFLRTLNCIQSTFPVGKVRNRGLGAGHIFHSPMFACIQSNN